MEQSQREQKTTRHVREMGILSKEQTGKDNTLLARTRGSLHLEVADVLEDKGVVDVDGLADLVVHGVDVGLVHGHALLGQR